MRNKVNKFPLLNYELYVIVTFLSDSYLYK